MTFGETIRHLREHHPMTLRELAQRIGVSIPYVHDVETGKRAPFADDKRLRVYDALELDAGQRAELEFLRIAALGKLDISGLGGDAVRRLIAFRDELRMEEESK